MSLDLRAKIYSCFSIFVLHQGKDLKTLLLTRRMTFLKARDLRINYSNNDSELILTPSIPILAQNSRLFVLSVAKRDSAE